VRLRTHAWRVLVATVLIAAAIAVGTAASSRVAASQRSAREQPATPPVSMTCPMHPDVVESRPGNCPLCRMALVPVRLAAAWSCPLHPGVLRDESGNCPICRRPLNRVTVSLTWTCPADPKVDALDRGTCADGTRMVLRRTLRAHGDHNPRHGGQFFMAPDNWHHLEGTYPRSRVFRLYVYDDFARPLNAAQLRTVKGRAVTRETFDPTTRASIDVTAFPLAPARDGSYLEARLEDVTLPLNVTAKVRIKPDGPEYRFDFTFPTTTTEPPRAPSPAAARPPTAARPPAAAAVAPPPAPEAPPAAPEPGALDVVAVPTAMNEMLSQLQLRRRHVRELIDAGNLTAVWVPAFQAKDIAVALEPHVLHLDPARREGAADALARIVRFAWLLDAIGDVGNRQQLVDAYAPFTRAVDDVGQAFSNGR
jgi:hypothetical protein